jgi:hypothetical protein
LLQLFSGLRRKPGQPVNISQMPEINHINKPIVS